MGGPYNKNGKAEKCIHFLSKILNGNNHWKAEAQIR
jgi:hypothetical protein